MMDLNMSKWKGLSNKQLFDKIVSGEIKQIGIMDFWDWSLESYHPCKFVKVVNKEKLEIEIYEPSINKYHLVQVDSSIVWE